MDPAAEKPRMDAPARIGDSRVILSRDALLHNVQLLRGHLPPDTKLCAVIKADAYGHDASLVADALVNFSRPPLEAPAVDALAVATVQEAAALGEQPVPVMILRPVESVYLGRQREMLAEAIERQWVLSISSAAAAGDVARLAVSLRRRAVVQVMVDTGMAREGAPLDAVPEVLSAISVHASLRLSAICTHFANADQPGHETLAAQLARFRSATDAFARAHPRVIRHAANSGAVFFAPDAGLQMVRPGIALYGVDPTGVPTLDRPLRPALKWTSPILMVRSLRAGQTSGYGQTWTAQRDSVLGLVPVGYADGYNRAFSNRGVMLVHGKRAPVVGRVSMDSTMIDLTDIPSVRPGDEAVLMDSDPISPASVYELARWADTIPYEILTRIGQRVQRVAVDPPDAPPRRRDERGRAVSQRT